MSHTAWHTAWATAHRLHHGLRHREAGGGRLDGPTEATDGPAGGLNEAGGGATPYTQLRQPA